MSEQYLKDSVLLLIDENSVENDNIISSDNYNETKIYQRIMSLNEDDKFIMHIIAVQLAVIGYGGRNFGAIRFKDQTIEITDFFDKHNVLYKNNINAVLKDDDLTPRRLIRLFRYQIKNFIVKNNRPSYLLKKYSPYKNKIDVIFPGAEHLVDDPDDFKMLIKTYQNVDIQLARNTTITKRIIRVGIARGLIPYDYEE